MGFKIVNPVSLGSPRGYSNGLLSDSEGKLLFVSGQVGWNQDQQIVSDNFVEQFDRALANLLTVVTDAGGEPTDVARLVIYVTDINEYRRQTKGVGDCYRARMGKHFPAMVLVEVKSLLEEAAKVEIEGVALLRQ